MTRRSRNRRLVCPHPLDPVCRRLPGFTPQLRRSGRSLGGQRTRRTMVVAPASSFPGQPPADRWILL